MCALLLGITAGLSGCSEQGIGHAYFPLGEGRVWHYRVERTTMDGTRELRHSLRTARPPGELAHVDAMRQTIGGGRYLYAIEDAAVYRFAADGTAAAAPGPDSERALVMPADPAPGTNWTTPTVTAVLENTGPPWETLFRIEVPVTLSYSVAAVDATVSTPAGAFNDCVLLIGQGKTNADVGNYIGLTDIAVETREWFAPGVGLVRMERVETTQAAALNQGRLVMELVRWED